MRHAKSNWGDPALADHDRPLNARGRAAAPRMGELLRSSGKRVDAMVSSTAVRALPTAQGVAQAAGFHGEVFTDRRLYLAGPEDIVGAISETACAAEALLVVGHNPGMQDLVSHWAGRVERVPTATVAEFTFKLNTWAELNIQALAGFVGIWRPKELDSM